MTNLTSSSTYLDRSLQREMRTFRRAELVLQLGNMLAFGMSLVLIVVGILYLTVYYYEYSFTTYSINLLAGFFIAIGFVLLFISLACIFMLKPDGSPIIVASFIVFLVISFITLIVLGSVGLGMKDSDELLYETQASMRDSMSKYDSRNQYNHHSKRIDWLQRRFSCCGFNSYADWRSRYFGASANNYDSNIHLSNDALASGGLQNGYGLGGGVGFGNNLPYRDDLPDSCCINKSPGCGRRVFNTLGRQESNLFYTAGCQSIYYKYFSYDVTFLGALAICVSLVLLMCAIILTYGHLLSKSSSSRQPYSSVDGKRNNPERVQDDDQEDERENRMPKPNYIKEETSKPVNVYSSQKTVSKPIPKFNESEPVPINIKPSKSNAPYYMNDNQPSRTAYKDISLETSTNYSRSPNVGSYYTSRLNY